MQSQVISDILADTLQKGNFLSCVLTDHEGLLIQSATANSRDPDIQAAMIGIIRKVVIQANEQLGISPTTEFTLTDSEGNLIVCRLFSAKGMELALSFLIPGKNYSYRRLMNRAINQITIALDV